MKYNPEIFDLIKEINLKARHFIGCEHNADVFLNNGVVRDMTTSSFWASAKGKLYIMKTDNTLGDYALKDAHLFMLKTFGELFDSEQLKDLIIEIDTEAAKKQGAGSSAKKAPAKEPTAEELEKKKAAEVNNAEAEAEKIKAGAISKVYAMHDVAWNSVLNHIKYYNLRNSIEMKVDMFTDVGRMDILDESVRVIYPHVPFDVYIKEPRQDIIADYKEHFALLDSVLDFIVAARFARDRKRAYIWFRCDSDWGKGFFLALLSQNFNMAVEMSVKEIEGIFEGKPAGKSMVDFKRALILAVDEFKSARSELKQLQNTISLAPKHQLSQKVEVFVKIFMSAEAVPSFASADGIEDQFANRFNYLDLTGSLADREMFKTVGRAVYFDNCQAYVANYLNVEIEKYVALGKAGAEKKAEAAVDSFFNEHRIGNTFDTFSSNMGSFSESFIDWLIDWRLQSEIRTGGSSSFTYSEYDKDIYEKLMSTDDGWFIKSPSKLVAKWIDSVFDKSIAGSLMHKRGQIVTASVEPTDKNKPIGVRVKGVKHNGFFLRMSDDQRERLNAGAYPAYSGDPFAKKFPTTTNSTGNIAALMAKRKFHQLPDDGSEDDILDML